MVNYGNGKIYKIEDLAGEMCYIGSTTKDYLSKRMVDHRYKYNEWLNGRLKTNLSVFRIFEQYGIDRCRIGLIELFPCETRDELLMREAHYITKLECVNKNIPMRTHEQSVIHYQEYHQEYNKLHVEVKKQKTTCDCGATFRKTDANRHEKTIKHINYIANQPIDI